MQQSRRLVQLSGQVAFEGPFPLASLGHREFSAVAGFSDSVYLGPQLVDLSTVLNASVLGGL